MRDAGRPAHPHMRVAQAGVVERWAGHTALGKALPLYTRASPPLSPYTIHTINMLRKVRTTSLLNPC